MDALVAGPRDLTDWDALRRQLLAICEIESIKARAGRAGQSEADEIVCRCKQVTRGRIAGLVDEGATPQDITRVTGAGQTCGGCAIAVETILGRATLAPATLVGREALDRLHTRFTFAVPDIASLPVAGDHVLVEASIYGRALSRAYTLTGWDVAARTFEIIVRYEANGVFSRWLHDFADGESLLRVSRPSGARVRQADEPMFFLAGGIGVTPAIARLRAQTSLSPAIWLHWSARFAPGSALTREVEALAAQAPLAMAVLRDTAREGRLTRDEIAATLPFQGLGSVHVCGPVTFMDDMVAALSAAGWPAERIVRESFVSAVAAPLRPERAAFASLGLKWFALPAVADMALDLGGLHYTAAPSSGVYMGTEIGSFNLSDPRRYDLLPRVAEALGTDVSDDNPLWRDQALLEVNRAVLHSFRRAGVRILDHHALSRYFMKFMAQEKAESRPVYGHWPWIVPPMSANLSAIWHDKTLKNVIVKPNYFYQKRGGYLVTIGEAAATTCPVDATYAGPFDLDDARCPAH